MGKQVPLQLCAQPSLCELCDLCVKKSVEGGDYDYDYDYEGEGEGEGDEQKWPAEHAKHTDQEPDPYGIESFLSE